MTEKTSSNSLCIFANFFIDNEERLLRMKDSFYSFRDVQPEEWRINIRGRLKHEARDFLYSELRDNLSVHFLESNKGWFYDSHTFMQDVQSDFVFFWIEDHICINQSGNIRKIMKDMFDNEIDVVPYSQRHNDNIMFYSKIGHVAETENLTIHEFNDEMYRNTRKESKEDIYVISAPSLLTTNFFLFILNFKKPRIKRWSRFLPFDFEKTSLDLNGYNIRKGFPKYELFVTIDDDNGNEGYSLISRGLYPSRISRLQLKQMEFSIKERKHEYLSFLKPFYRTVLRILFTMKIK